MSNLKYESVRSALRKIGAVKADGTPYKAVRGVSVSATGEHFRFWRGGNDDDDDVKEHEDRIDIERSYAGRPPRSKWLLSSQGRKFFESLVSAQATGRPIYGIVNERALAQDAHGNAAATAAAPILTALGQPAKGRVLLVNPRTGEFHVRFSRLDTETGKPAKPPMPAAQTVLTTAELASALAGGDSYIRTRDGNVLGLALRRDLNPKAPNIVVVGKGPRIEANANLLMGWGQPVPVYIKEGTNAWRPDGQFIAVAYKKDARTIDTHRGDRPRSKVAGILFLEREGAALATSGSKGYFVDPAVRMEVETAAVAFVTHHYEQDGFVVSTVEKDNVGYDLIATRSEEVWHVEVKGTSSDEARFFISRNEWNRAAWDARWLLAIVIGATTTSPQLELVTATEAKKKFAFDPLCWECTLLPHP